jgi:sugar phosphate isomerase/epimerase
VKKRNRLQKNKLILKSVRQRNSFAASFLAVRAATAKLRKDGYNMQAGVSTACLYPMELEKSLYELAVRGVECTEIFVNTHCEMFDPYLSQMKNIQKQTGIKVKSVHPYTCSIEPIMFFTKYERRINDFLEYYKNYLNYMNEFGAEILVLHGNKNENKFPDEAYFERFALLQELAESFGVCVAQENVSRCTSGSLAFLEKMKSYLGDKAKFVLDIKQAHRAGEDPISMVRALENSIVHIHFSDCGKSGDCLLYGEGEYDNDAFFKELNKINYTDSILLELYRDGYNKIEDLIENYRLLKCTVDKYSQ